MWTPGSPSLNTHQMALRTLTDRCSNQQRKLDELEREKLTLCLRNEELRRSLDKLDQENMELRQQNLVFGHQFYASQTSMDSPLSKSSSLTADSSTEDLLNDVLNVRESMNLVKKTLLQQQNIVKKMMQETRLRLEEATNSSMQDSINLNPAPLEETEQMHDEIKQQICPMCEAHFPAVSCTHEDFVTHVNSHFTIEDQPDTLTNFEVVDENDVSMTI